MEREKLIAGFGEVRNKRSEKGSDGEKEVENIFFPINSTFNVQRNRLLRQSHQRAKVILWLRGLLMQQSSDRRNAVLWMVARK